MIWASRDSSSARLGGVGTASVGSGLDVLMDGPNFIERALDVGDRVPEVLPLLPDFGKNFIERRPLGARIARHAGRLGKRRASDGGQSLAHQHPPRRRPQLPGHSTINRDLRTLRAALKRARGDFRFPAGAFLPEDARVRWLRPEEELLVLETMRSPFREIAKLAALTLMRLSEVRTLRREFVHLEQGVVMLPKAKGGARPIILSAQAQKVIRGQLEAHDREYVFPGPDGQPFERSYVGACSGAPPGQPASETSIFTTSAITGRPWPSTRDSPRRS
jgi:integrase